MWNNRLPFFLILGALVLFPGMACRGGARPAVLGEGAAEKGAAPEGPQAGLAEGELLLASGEKIIVELAVTPRQREIGLMRREKVEEGRGMLFVFPYGGRHSMWMRHMKIAIDMLWLDAEGRVLHVERGAPPCPELPCPSYGAPPEAEVWYVLELGEGQALRYGLEPGARVLFKDVPKAEEMQTGAFGTLEPTAA